MGAWAYLKGTLIATWTGLRHLFHPRMTLKYPEQKLDLENAGYPVSPRRPAGLTPGYKYDPIQGVGVAGFKGRHILYFEKCTGCQLCAIACDGIAVAIDMQKVPKGKPQNKKDVWPAVDYGRCVPPSTPITTIDGVRPMSEIRVGDKVLTHTGRFQRVTRLFHRYYTGKLYTFHTLGNPESLTTTEDHPILTYENGETSWSFAAEIREGSFLTRPVVIEPVSSRLPEDLYGPFDLESSRGLVSEHAHQSVIPSRVVSVGIAQVNDFEVLNLEVEEDNSYVAANQSVHNCVFCGLCVTPDTEVMTNPGLKQISELTLKDHVLTHTGEYRPVTKIWDFEYTGQLYTIKVAGHPNPLTCTADHRLLGVHRPIGTRRDGRLVRTAGPVELILPGDLKVGDYLVTPIPKRIINLDQYVLQREGAGGRERLVLPTEPGLFRLIGYYLAEGSAYDPLRRVTLSFGSQEHNLIRDSSRLFERYFKKAAGIDYLQQHVANVRLGSSLALEFFKQFGQGAPKKSMPDWVFFANRERQIELIRGIWLGDGCVVNQPRHKYLNTTTTSKVLANQIQLVLARIGIVSAVAVEHPKNKLAVYRINVFGRWAIELAKLMGAGFDYSPTKNVDRFLLTTDYIFSPIKSITQSAVTKTRVMDITVDEDHTFVGMGIAQHNCVDACPFDALYMTDDYELSAYDKMALKYTPDMLAVPPKLEGKKYKVKFDTEKGEIRYG